MNLYHNIYRLLHTHYFFPVFVLFHKLIVEHAHITSLCLVLVIFYNLKTVLIIVIQLLYYVRGPKTKLKNTHTIDVTTQKIREKVTNK